MLPRCDLSHLSPQIVRARIDTNGAPGSSSCRPNTTRQGEMVMTTRIRAENSHASSGPFRSIPRRVRRRFIWLSPPTQTVQNTPIWRYPQYPQGSCLCYRSAITGEHWASRFIFGTTKGFRRGPPFDLDGHFDLRRAARAGFRLRAIGPGERLLSVAGASRRRLHRKGSSTARPIPPAHDYAAR